PSEARAFSNLDKFNIEDYVKGFEFEQATTSIPKDSEREFKDHVGQPPDGRINLNASKFSINGYTDQFKSQPPQFETDLYQPSTIMFHENIQQVPPLNDLNESIQPSFEQQQRIQFPPRSISIARDYSMHQLPTNTSQLITDPHFSTTTNYSQSQSNIEDYVNHYLTKTNTNDFYASQPSSNTYIQPQQSFISDGRNEFLQDNVNIKTLDDAIPFLYPPPIHDYDKTSIQNNCTTYYPQQEEFRRVQPFYENRRLIDPSSIENNYNLQLPITSQPSQVQPSTFYPHFSQTSTRLYDKQKDFPPPPTDITLPQDEQMKDRHLSSQMKIIPISAESCSTEPVSIPVQFIHPTKRSRSLQSRYPTQNFEYDLNQTSVGQANQSSTVSSNQEQRLPHSSSILSQVKNDLRLHDYSKPFDINNCIKQCFESQRRQNDYPQMPCTNYQKNFAHPSVHRDTYQQDPRNSTRISSFNIPPPHHHYQQQQQQQQQGIYCKPQIIDHPEQKHWQQQKPQQNSFRPDSFGTMILDKEHHRHRQISQPMHNSSIQDNDFTLTKQSNTCKPQSRHQQLPTSSQSASFAYTPSSEIQKKNLISFPLSHYRQTNLEHPCQQRHRTYSQPILPLIGNQQPRRQNFQRPLGKKKIMSRAFSVPPQLHSRGLPYHQIQHPFRPLGDGRSYETYVNSTSNDARLDPQTGLCTVPCPETVKYAHLPPHLRPEFVCFTLPPAHLLPPLPPPPPPLPPPPPPPQRVKIIRQVEPCCCTCRCVPGRTLVKKVVYKQIQQEQQQECDSQYNSADLMNRLQSRIRIRYGDGTIGSDEAFRLANYNEPTRILDFPVYSSGPEQQNLTSLTAY
ncbi:unnamed protein product, partial [Didymodactylos carnosus]